MLFVYLCVACLLIWGKARKKSTNSCIQVQMGLWMGVRIVAGYNFKNKIVVVGELEIEFKC